MRQAHAVLLRRCYWLRKYRTLTNELAWQINHPDSKYYNLELDNQSLKWIAMFSSRSFNAKNLKILLSGHFRFNANASRQHQQKIKS